MSYNAVLGNIDRKTSRNNTTKIEISDVEFFDMLELILSLKDKETNQHTKRTRRYTRILLHRMLREDKFKATLIIIDHESIAEIMAIHDIGKIGIGDDILLKPGRLTPEEFDEVKTHVDVGLNILDSILVGRKTENAAIKNCYDIIRCHHERWDGSGYPNGLKGKEIPLSARIAAISDVYDALTSKRSYKDARSHIEAVQIITSGAGSHFDPDIVRCFLGVEQNFQLLLENPIRE